MIWIGLEGHSILHVHSHLAIFGKKRDLERLRVHAIKRRFVCDERQDILVR